MLQRIIGIVGVLVVAGVITMLALEPRAEGFYPNLFDSFEQRNAPAKEVPTKKITVPTAEDVKTVEING